MKTDFYLLNILLFLFLSGLSQNVLADIVYFKDGGKVEGIIIKETPEKLVIQISVGEMDIDHGDILKVVRSSDEEINNIKEEYEEAQKVNEQYYKAAQKTKLNKEKRYKLKTVIILSAEWCVYCKRAMALFQANNIPFSVYDIEKSTKGKAAYEKYGKGGIPIILIGNQVIRGLNIPAIDAALKRKDAWDIK